MVANPRPLLIRGIGNSMTPILKSHDVVRVDPVPVGVVLSKGDIVLARVNGRVYLHKITGVKAGKKRIVQIVQYQISNNHGHVNGWTADVVGKVREKWEPSNTEVR